MIDLCDWRSRCMICARLMHKKNSSKDCDNRDNNNKNINHTLGSYNPWQKSLGQCCNMHIFPSFLGSLLKTASFSKSSCSSPSSHPIQSWISQKILDKCIQHCLWGEGRGWTCVNWKTPQKSKSVPRLLSMIVEKLAKLTHHECLHTLTQCL